MVELNTSISSTEISSSLNTSGIVLSTDLTTTDNLSANISSTTDLNTSVSTTENLNATIDFVNIDCLVKVSANDTNADYLGLKLTGGSGVTLVEVGDGGNETLRIDVSVSGAQHFVDINGDIMTGSLFTPAIYSSGLGVNGSVYINSINAVNESVIGAYITATGSITDASADSMIGIYGKGIINSYSTGTGRGTSIGVQAEGIKAGTGNAQSVFGVKIDNTIAGGSIARNYGLYISPLINSGVLSVGDYGVYVAGTGSNYFAGNIVTSGNMVSIGSSISSSIYTSGVNVAGSLNIIGNQITTGSISCSGLTVNGATNTINGLNASGTINLGPGALNYYFKPGSAIISCDTTYGDFHVGRYGTVYLDAGETIVGNGKEFGFMDTGDTYSSSFKFSTTPADPTIRLNAGNLAVDYDIYSRKLITSGLTISGNSITTGSAMSNGIFTSGLTVAGSIIADNLTLTTTYNPFDQSLNTTNDIQFNNIYSTGSINISGENTLNFDTDVHLFKSGTAVLKMSNNLLVDGAVKLGGDRLSSEFGTLNAYEGVVMGGFFDGYGRGASILQERGDTALKPYSVLCGYEWDRNYIGATDEPLRQVYIGGTVWQDYTSPLWQAGPDANDIMFWTDDGYTETGQNSYLNLRILHDKIWIGKAGQLTTPYYATNAKPRYKLDIGDGDVRIRGTNKVGFGGDKDSDYTTYLYDPGNSIVTTNGGLMGGNIYSNGNTFMETATGNIYWWDGISSYDTGISRGGTGTVQITNNLLALGSMSCSGASISGDLIVTGSVSITGNTYVTGSISTADYIYSDKFQATTGNYLSTAGARVSQLNVDGNSYLKAISGDDLGIHTSGTLRQFIDVEGNNTFYGNSTTSGNTYFNGDLTVVGSTSIAGTLSTGHIGIGSNISASGYLITNLDANGSGNDLWYNMSSTAGNIYEQTYVEGGGIKRYTPNDETIYAGTCIYLSTDWSNIYLDPGQGGAYYWSQDEIRIGRVGQPKLNFVNRLTGNYDTDIQRTDYETLMTNGNLIALETVQAKNFSIQTPDASEILYYKLDELSGTNVIDYSVTGVNGTATNWDAGGWNYGGKIGNGCLFSIWLATSYVDSNQDAPFQFGSGNFTLNIWAKDAVAGNDYFIGKGGTTGDYYGIGIDASSNAFMDIGGTRATLPTTLNRWHMITGVRSGNEINVYVDGVSGTAADISGLTASPSGNNLLIGGRHPTEVALTTLSTLDEARVFSRALSSSEVLDLYHSKLGKVDGFTGTGSYTNFTIVGGIITSAT